MEQKAKFTKVLRQDFRKKRLDEQGLVDDRSELARWSVRPPVRGSHSELLDTCLPACLPKKKGRARRRSGRSAQTAESHHSIHYPYALRFSLQYGKKRQGKLLVLGSQATQPYQPAYATPPLSSEARGYGHKMGTGNCQPHRCQPDRGQDPFIILSVETHRLAE